MKKLFTLFVAILGAHIVATAQSFEFKYKGTVYENGSKVTINAETDPTFGDLNCETNPSSNPEDGLLIVGKDGAYINGTAHLAVLEHTFKAKTIQWCMGGACVPMPKDDPQLDKTFDGTSIQVMFDAFTIRQEGYLLAQLDVTVGSESQTLYIEFSNGQTSGINNLTAIEGHADVYDFSGRLVMQNADCGTRQMLRPGAYIIKNGKTARKMIVK